MLPMEITELLPTRFDLPGGEEPVYITTQRWVLEPWEGEDPPELGRTWSRSNQSGPMLICGVSVLASDL